MMNMIMALMVSQLYTYPQIHQVVHTIYTVLCVNHTAMKYLKKKDFYDSSTE